LAVSRRHFVLREQSLCVSTGRLTEGEGKYEGEEYILRDAISLQFEQHGEMYHEYNVCSHSSDKIQGA
jgi:hypothetical protein